MNFKRLGTIGAIAIAGTILLASCAANEGGETAAPSDLSGTIDGAGASSQGSAQEAWIAAFQTANPDVTINYDPSGSGAGREAFIAGGVSFAGTDSALKQEEIDGGFAGCTPDTDYLQVPAYISPIAVIFNVEGVDELNLDSATLAKIFKGEITSWDDPAIAALNEGTTFPSAPITAVHRSDDSGTTKNFADYLFKTAPDVWDAEPADPFPYATGEAAQGTSGVVDAVTNGTNTIGYADASKAGDLGTAAILVGDEFVNYTPEAAAAVVAESPAGDTNNGTTDLAIKLDRKTTDPSHYPLVLVSYIITCTDFVDAEVAPLVKAYVGYITSEAGQAEAAASAGAAPLSADLSAKVATALEAIVVK
ncbi:phosphate ABC transporter substrate-binding protein PstS [Leifsonia sp. H3M29-4]|uniref:phosphate ABC transporter substrate-binding protein PstS n=1 Tax=Salinibacterium metalliresistens TaxID=3031321 RepID=UPI0023DB0020|nr:phosphate ABC transporter substrate-binding protein PstS [Salinibacterium metalliresistens]MDF1478231.1 phosphate ABC transporter substrate-binding protein PstS [Salinibacterium metalliresistens]